MSGMYVSGRTLFLTANCDWASDNYDAILVDDRYVVDYSNHQFRSALGAASISTVALQNMVVVAGAADADDAVFPNVTDVGHNIIGIAIVKNESLGPNDPLVCFLDSGTGLPITPNGTSILVQWDNGNNRIFRP